MCATRPVLLSGSANALLVFFAATGFLTAFAAGFLAASFLAAAFFGAAFLAAGCLAAAFFLAAMLCVPLVCVSCWMLTHPVGCTDNALFDVIARRCREPPRCSGLVICEQSAARQAKKSALPAFFRGFLTFWGEWHRRGRPLSVHGASAWLPDG